MVLRGMAVPDDELIGLATGFTESAEDANILPCGTEAISVCFEIEDG